MPGWTTPRPWHMLTGHDRQVIISNTVRPDWASPKHFVCETSKANAKLIVKAVNAYHYRKQNAQ